MVLIERLMASLAVFIACDLFRLDSRDVERAREQRTGRPAPGAPVRRDDRQVIVRFGR